MVWIYPHLTHPMLNQRIGITARARVDTGSLPNAIFEETFVDIAIGIVGRRFSWRCQDHQETWRRNEEISCVFSIPENSGKTAKNLGLSWCSPFKLPCFLGGPLCSDNIMFFSNRKCYHWHLTQIFAANWWICHDLSMEHGVQQNKIFKECHVEAQLQLLKHRVKQTLFVAEYMVSSWSSGRLPWPVLWSQWMFSSHLLLSPGCTSQRNISTLHWVRWTRWWP